MVDALQSFKTRMGIQGPNLRNKGFNYAPFVVQQGQQTPGQLLSDKLGTRVDSGENIYTQNKQKITGRLASNLVDKSAGLKLDEFGRPDIKLTNFGELIGNQNKSVQERGQSALAAEQAKSAWQQAVDMQNIGSYGFSGMAGGGVSGSDIPGAKSGNVGARAASMAMKVMQNHTAYVWGGNSLSRGVDCSGLVQQIYRQLGVNVPRVTTQQARNGRQVSVANIRPGDLVFYGRDMHHVGIYVGNGRVVHAANPRLGVIQSTLTNSNGAPSLILRPY